LPEINPITWRGKIMVSTHTDENQFLFVKRNLCVVLDYTTIFPDRIFLW